MVRDFTEATKERLSKVIDDINKKTWSPVTDFLGDVFMYGGKWLGLISLKDDMSNVESYQRKVLDMTDMTKKELKKIFEDVYSIDKNYMDKFLKLNEDAEVLNSKLELLYSMLQPNFTICDAKTIVSMTAAYNMQLQSIAGKINKDFEEELDWAAKEAALESAKGLLGSAFKIVVDVVTLPVSLVKNIATGNPGKIFTDTWAIIDDVFAVGSNLVGLASLGIGYGISELSGGDNEMKHMAITYAEAYGGVKGLTDTLEAEEKTNGKSGATSLLLAGSKCMDMASTAVTLYSDAKKMLDDPSAMIDENIGFKKKLEPLKKADMLDKYQDDYRHWQSLYRHFGKDNHYILLKNISNGYKYAESLWEVPSSGWDSAGEAFSKTTFESSQKWFKSLCDLYEVCDIVNEWDAGILIR